MSNVNLAWKSAEVEDGALTVPLEGELPKGWKQSFERTVKLLGDGQWGEVKLKKDVVRVTDVVPGNEEKLRHHLEAIVAQANAVDERKEAEAEEESNEDAKAEPEGPDAEMTAQFRAFADQDAAGEDDG